MHVAIKDARELELILLSLSSLATPSLANIQKPSSNQIKHIWNLIISTDLQSCKPVLGIQTCKYCTFRALAPTGIPLRHCHQAYAYDMPAVAILCIMVTLKYHAIMQELWCADMEDDLLLEPGSAFDAWLQSGIPAADRLRTSGRSNVSTAHGAITERDVVMAALKPAPSKRARACIKRSP